MPASCERSLTLAEPPKIIQCITDPDIMRRKYFELVEGETLSTTCIVHGDPKPFLQCYLLNKQGKVDNGQITSKERRNFTDGIGKRLRFHNLRRTVTKIECEIDGGSYAGKIMRWRNVVVFRKCSFTSNSFLSSGFGVPVKVHRELLRSREVGSISTWRHNNLRALIF